MYLYRCGDCNYQEERSKHKKKCPKCSSKDFRERTHYLCPETGKYELYKYTDGPYISVRLSDSEITIGMLGERNFKRNKGIIEDRDARKAEIEAKDDSPIHGYKRVKKTNKHQDKVWWRNKNQPINTALGGLSDEKKKEYIIKGTK
jgi:hypothetical protein